MLLADAQINVNAQGGSFYGTGDVLAANGQLVTNVVLAGATAIVVGSDVTTTRSRRPTSRPPTRPRRSRPATVAGPQRPARRDVYQYLGDHDRGRRSASTSRRPPRTTPTPTLWQKVADVSVEAPSRPPASTRRSSAPPRPAPTASASRSRSTRSAGRRRTSSSTRSTRCSATRSSRRRSTASGRPRASRQVIDSTITAAGDVPVTALNAAQLNATVSNAASSVAVGDVRREGQERRRHPRVEQGLERAPRRRSTTRPSPPAATSRSPPSTTPASSRTSRSSPRRPRRTTAARASSRTRSTTSSPADFLSSEGVQALKLGDRVRVAPLHTAGGTVGGVYRYLGQDETRDLSAEDYTDLGYWQPVAVTTLIPQGST